MEKGAGDSDIVRSVLHVAEAVVVVSVVVHIAQEVAVVNPHVGAGLDADGITVLCEYFLDREVTDDRIRLTLHWRLDLV